MLKVIYSIQSAMFTWSNFGNYRVMSILYLFGDAEAIEASVIYVRFKAAANELKQLLEEIEIRRPSKEYIQILVECHKLYCEQRLSLRHSARTDIKIFKEGRIAIFSHIKMCIPNAGGLPGRTKLRAGSCFKKPGVGCC